MNIFEGGTLLYVSRARTVKSAATLTFPSLLGIVAPVWAAPAAPSASPAPVQARLTILAGDAKPCLSRSTSADKSDSAGPQNPSIQLAPTDGVYDFGLTSFLLTNRLDHTFVLRNDTKALLTIQQIQTSCGCTRATLGDKPLILSSKMRSHFAAWSASLCNLRFWFKPGMEHSWNKASVTENN